VQRAIRAGLLSIIPVAIIARSEQLTAQPRLEILHFRFLKNGAVARDSGHL
jgi:hypothetical protein